MASPLQDQEDRMLLNALHTMVSSGIHADLILVAFSPSNPSVEKLFGVHKFVLNTFNPSFYTHCISRYQQSTKNTVHTNANTSNTSTSTNIEQTSTIIDNSSASPKSLPSKSNNNKEIPRVYLNDIGAESLSLFLENVYTSALRHANDYTKEERAAYEEYRLKFPTKPKINLVGKGRILDFSDLVSCVNTEGSFPDVTFLMDDGQRVFAHKAMMSTRSEVFRAMFDEAVGLTEAHQDTVILPQIDTECFISLLNYIYGADVAVSPSVAVEMLLVSDRFALSHLHAATQDVVSSFVCCETACDIFMVASRVRASELEDKCLKFIANRSNLPEVVASEGFLSLEQDLIIQIATEITRTFDRTYRPSEFVAEILYTIHLMGRDSVAVQNLSTLIAEMCTNLGVSRREDELYTSRIRSDLLKDKLLHYRCKFEEVTHKPLYPTTYTKNRDKRFLHYFPDPTDTITKQLAALLNVDVGMVMKCLVFWWYFPDNKRDRQYIVVLTCGNERIDINMLEPHVPKEALVFLASSEHVYRKLGASALWKLIPPLGFRTKIPTLIEERVMQQPVIYIPSGKQETTWKMNPNDLVVMFANEKVPCSIAPLVGIQPSVTRVPTIDESNSEIKSQEDG